MDTLELCLRPGVVFVQTLDSVADEVSLYTLDVFLVELAGSGRGFASRILTIDRTRDNAAAS